MRTRYAVPVGTRVDELEPAAARRVFERGGGDAPEIERSVAGIVAAVRERGDAALVDLAARYDGAAELRIEVPRAAWDEALAAMDPGVRAGLEEAARNVEVVHRAQLPAAYEVEVRPGVRVGGRPDPLGRVAVYAPGGRAAYPSSVLMGAVPARVAGVGEVVVCSPPGPGGAPPPAVLAACAIAGVDRVFALGGAGAIAAVAYGTATVPAVDKVVGPGNAYVTEAKRQLNGVVASDAPAGPSEVLVLADETASPTRVARELIAQAEHDPDAASVLVATSAALIDGVARLLDGMMAGEPRRSTVEAALAARGALLLADDRQDMLDFAARYAPEHLALYVRDPRGALAGVRNAGAVFLGDDASVAFGDYITGGNHVLPTAGAARSRSGLSALDFIRWTFYQEVSAPAAGRLAPLTAALARSEGLPAHAAAALLREEVPR